MKRRFAENGSAFIWSRPLQQRRILLVLLFLCVPAGAAAAHPALIPLPSSVAWHEGRVQLGGEAVVEAPGGAAPTAAYLAHELGLKLGAHGAVRLSLVPKAGMPGPEAYHLRAGGNEVSIVASDPRGLFYGVQTLRQLVTIGAGGVRSVPAVDISDAPRFRYRGLLIDVSRHFFGKRELFKIIDQMAAYKLNALQLHLTDDPGWRLEIPGYPRLTDIGAMGDASDPKRPRQYFTEGDIREIVAYAADRHIIVVPEIEMPGHAGSEARAYPQFFDTDGHFNPGKPETYAFIRAVMTQVARLFPGPYIHFGGDEVDDSAWQSVPEVQKLKAERGLKTTAEVEAYFGHRVVDIIHGVRKRPMAWDEQVEAAADKSIVIFWWRKGRPDVLTTAANAGYDLVMSPVDQVYFDYHQAPGEPGAPWEGNDNGPTSIGKILAWEPVPASFTPAQSARVLGVEAAVWTEFIQTERYLEFMTFPRLLAFAEVAWRPKGARDEKEFSERLAPHLDALRANGINARRDEGDGYEFITH
jgi:hexosaminidase